eukprot:347697-Chlamydomonas_euryale.AAC.2
MAVPHGPTSFGFAGRSTPADPHRQIHRHHLGLPAGQDGANAMFYALVCVVANLVVGEVNMTTNLPKISVNLNAEFELEFRVPGRGVWNAHNRTVSCRPCPGQPRNVTLGWPHKSRTAVVWIQSRLKACTCALPERSGAALRWCAPAFPLAVFPLASASSAAQQIC